MFKLLAITFNLLALFLFGIFFEEVNVEQIVPENVELGNEFMVTVSIEKDQIDGYAKYQADLPPGVTAKSVENGTAKFKFEDNKAKFIWMNLPSESTFTVSYLVTVNDPSITSVPISGTFSYLSDNQRMTLDVLQKTVVMGPIEKAKEAQPLAMVEVKRDIRNLNNDLYQVDLHIISSNVKGFAKIQDVIPAGGEVKSLEVGESVFSVVNTKVKFVWMNFPTNRNEITVSYQIDLKNAVSKNINDLAGEFAYIEGEESKKVLITNPESVSFIAQNNNNQNQGSTKTNTSSTPAPKPVATAVASSKQKVNVPVTSTPSPENGVVYKVQIMAAHKSVNVNSFFASNYAFKEKVQIDLHEGWNKYLTGSFPTYLDARNKRNSIKNSYNFNGPFVVAYNSGQRITVQEALMITHQKWVN